MSDSDEEFGVGPPRPVSRRRRWSEAERLRIVAEIGEDVTETLEVIPRRWKVIQTVREKFTCRACEKISQLPAPFHATPRGWAGPNEQRHDLAAWADSPLRTSTPALLAAKLDPVHAAAFSGCLRFA